MINNELLTDDKLLVWKESCSFLYLRGVNALDVDKAESIRERIIDNDYIVWKLIDYLTGSVYGGSVKQLIEKDPLLWERLQTRMTLVTRGSLEK